MSRTASVAGCVLAVFVAAGTAGRADAPREISVEPRIVETSITGVSLTHVDLSLRVALRASQPATIRSMAFHDAFVGTVPVWIERIDGSWPLSPGRELVIPTLLQVRMHLRDAMAAEDLGAILRQGTVAVRTSVEVAIETPRMARWLFMGSTRTLVRDVELALPIRTDTTSLGPLAALGAGLADVAQRGAAGWLAAGLDRLSSRDDVARPFHGVVASVTSRYALEGPDGTAWRERRAAGVWWGPAVFCTTREAIAPWRFDVTDATALQLGRARLRTDGGAVAIGATSTRPSLQLDLAAVEQLLPAPRERKLYTLVDGRRQPLRLGERDADSNLVCLQVTGGDGTRSEASRAFHHATTGRTAGDVAAFSPGRSLTVVWTAVAPGPATRLQLTTPLYRASFGSPLVSGSRIVGVVASATTAWPAALVDTAAARAPRLPSAPVTTGTTSP
jgi:hypothetical protein